MALAKWRDVFETGRVMFLHGIASAFPSYAYTQAECWERIRESPQAGMLKAGSMRLLEKVLLGDSGIAKRHFCVEDPPEMFRKDAGALNADFEKYAPKLGGEALERALDRAGWRARELDALLVCTCTGYLCPGVSSHLAERLGIRADAYLQDLVGLGCGAAVPALRSASHFLAAHAGGKVAVVAVEICSAAFYVDDDPGVLISLCLFGDGASATVWGAGPPGRGAAYRMGGFKTEHKPEWRERIRFVNEGGKLKNKLHKTVPQLAAVAVRELFGRREGEAVDGLLVHPGGRDVVDAIESALPGEVLRQSRGVLRDYGNLSSPSVLVALERELEAEDAGGRLWLSAFGAGFSCHAAEVERVS